MKIIFQDSFETTDIDPHGKKFDRVSRLLANSETKDMQLTLDINTEIYPMSINDKFTFVLISSNETPTTVDDYDYVMYGKVYKYDDTAGARVSAYVSFGGLLLCLAGDSRHLQELNVGDNIYLMMRK